MQSRPLRPRERQTLPLHDGKFMERIVTARRLRHAPLSESPRYALRQRIECNTQPFGRNRTQATVEIRYDAIKVDAENK